VYGVGSWFPWLWFMERDFGGLGDFSSKCGFLGGPR
jgi:hypothetical protein